MVRKYNASSSVIPQNKREEINTKILYIIENKLSVNITGEDIYNGYTGIGGLHGLNKSDYNNFRAYTEAKQEIENGQFFTPDKIAEIIVDSLYVTDKDLVCDPTCGAGVFFNFVKEENCFGCDIDRHSINVANYLYPKSKIECQSILYYEPAVMFDYIVGNPPFNLKWHESGHGEIVSQDYFFKKCSELLKPGAILCCIVPESFMADLFFEKTRIQRVEDNFSFIGQVKLSDDAFKSLGVQSFGTKIMYWQRRTEHIEFNAYTPTFYNSVDEIKKDIAICLEQKNKAKAKIMSEMSQGIDRTFTDKLNKYLYEIKAHKSLSEYVTRALEYVERFYNQKCPANMEYSEWVKKHKITPTQVLSYLKRTVAKQDKKGRDEIRVVKTQYACKLKAYNGKSKLRRNEIYKTYDFSFNDNIAGVKLISQYAKNKEIEKNLQRRTNNYNLQTTPFTELERDSKIDNYLSEFTFLNKDNCISKFNEKQLNDLGLIIRKNYAILNWQQGSGKTPAGYAWSKYTPQRNTFIVSAALSIHGTWNDFMIKHKEEFVLLDHAKKLNDIRPGVYVLVAFDFLVKNARHIKKYIKKQSYKINLLFDESDEITNHNAKKTKAVLNVFRKAKRKLLTTGTTTRNNISELYSQLELLYNNSINMPNFCDYYYVETRDKEEGIILKRTDNKYYGQPFKAYYGATMFKRCFNPTKTTVFGIKKHNQDLYNEEALRQIIEYTVITRKFRDIAGDKYDVKNVNVFQNNAEREVYRKIINEFNEIMPKYYSKDINARKEALLRIIRQIQLLIKATSIPQFFSEYKGDEMPNKTKKILKLVEEYSGIVAIGCTNLEAVDYYYDTLKEKFPDRKIFKVVGDVNFTNRKKIITEFQDNDNSILICTQQSLKSSVNIPKCDYVIIESLQWNIPKIEQFYFRFIRYDSDNRTQVIFVNYADTIEMNLLALLMAKEKLNDYIKTLEYKDDSEIYNEYDIDLGILEQLITKKKDEDGKVKINWGNSKSV